MRCTVPVDGAKTPLVSVLPHCYACHSSILVLSLVRRRLVHDLRVVINPLVHLVDNERGVILLDKETAFKFRLNKLITSTCRESARVRLSGHGGKRVSVCRSMQTLRMRCVAVNTVLR